MTRIDPGATADVRVGLGMGLGWGSQPYGTSPYGGAGQAGSVYYTPAASSVAV